MYLEIQLKKDEYPIQIIHENNVIIENNLLTLILPDEHLVWSFDDIRSIRIRDEE